jgi:hypothetical protein
MMQPLLDAPLCLYVTRSTKTMDLFFDGSIQAATLGDVSHPLMWRAVSTCRASRIIRRVGGQELRGLSSNQYSSAACTLDAALFASALGLPALLRAILTDASMMTLIYRFIAASAT